MSLRLLFVSFVAAVLTACSGGSTSTPPLAPAPPYVPSSAGNPNLTSATVGSSDISAATSISNFHAHLFLRSYATNSVTTKTTSFPFDMNNHGGAKVTTATQHLLFVNGPSTTWGSPRTFLTDANANMSVSTAYYHMLDQYVGVTTNNRYPMGSVDVAVNLPIFADPQGGKMLSQGDVMSALHAGVVALGLTNPGYTHMFHIFLPPGVDQCFDYTAQCYSPDNSSTFFFCAYHGSVTFSDRGKVVFSVEPYQGSPTTPICYPGTTSLANGTDSTLSHEVFETISDPDGNTWWNSFTGNEIGDECVQNAVPAASLTLNAHAYVVQKEYSNAVHGCGP